MVKLLLQVVHLLTERDEKEIKRMQDLVKKYGVPAEVMGLKNT